MRGWRPGQKASGQLHYCYGSHTWHGIFAIYTPGTAYEKCIKIRHGYGDIFHAAKRAVVLAEHKWFTSLIGSLSKTVFYTAHWSSTPAKGLIMPILLPTASKRESKTVHLPVSDCPE